MIKPTVGRVVLYTPSKDDCTGATGMAMPYNGQKCVGFITSVHGDRMINIAGFDPNGKPFAVCSCTLLQDDDKPALDQGEGVWPVLLLDALSEGPGGRDGRAGKAAYGNEITPSGE